MSVATRILVVCTGNICRSPAVELLLAARLPLPLTVHSAGTSAVVGARIAPPMAALLDAAGVPIGRFAARQLTRAMIEQADLILTATRAHRSAVVSIEPTAVRRTFTLTEFARTIPTADPASLTHADPATRLGVLVTHARLSRSRLRLPPDVIDIPDPFRQSDEVYAAVFATISGAVGLIADALTTGTVVHGSHRRMTA